MRILATWSGGDKTFRYSGKVEEGTDIEYGPDFKRSANVSKDQYADLLRHFSNETVRCGTSHTAPPDGSLGAWLKQHVTQTGIASYVAPILCEEGYAKKTGARGELIEFRTTTGMGSQPLR